MIRHEDDESVIKLWGGEELTLEDSQDVSDNNDGVLIYEDERDSDPVFIEWDDVELIRFSR